MARGRSSRTRLRILGALLLVALFAGGFGWWHMHHWVPSRASYPVQGVEMGAQDGDIDWKAVKAIGADFAYLDASASAFARDPKFSRNMEEARAARLQVGAVHRYDPCQPAERQAANFVTVVPRDATLLPPAIDLDQDASQCPVKVSDAKLESELMTFLNQIEAHTGKPALLKLSRGFERHYHVAAAIDRNLWVTGDRFQPGYAGRPWTLWTANSGYANEAGEGPMRWVVVQP